VIHVASPATPDYNCVAWAAEDDQRWWWPDAQLIYYWPEDIPRKAAVETFVSAYGTLGYTPCPDASLESGFQKIAIYAHEGKPAHAARQLRNGFWTSKLGPDVDVIHVTPEEVTMIPGCQVYGRPVQFLRRPVQLA
jgi:hypothetical protein